MYLFKQIRVEKDTVLVGKAASEDLDHLARQGYEQVLDIMPAALRDKGLVRRVRAAGMKYRHIPVEECDLKTCHIEEERVMDFFRYLSAQKEAPIIINTDDEALGISLVMLAKVFWKGEPARELIRSIEALGISLKGRRDIKHFIRDFYEHYRRKMLPDTFRPGRGKTGFRPPGEGRPLPAGEGNKKATRCGGKKRGT